MSTPIALNGRQDKVLTCTGVWKIFQQGRRIIRALKDVSLEISSGEFISLTGGSGSGKSTLLNLLGSIDTPTKGKITALGFDIANMGESERDLFRREHVGFVFQDLRLISHLTAVENVALPALFSKTAHRDSLRSAARELEELGLAERLNHFPRELSYGEQQRVAFARAKSRRPKLLLADEPTANLDDANALLIVEALRKLRSQNVIVVVASHDPRLIESSDRIFRIRDGLLGELERRP